MTERSVTLQPATEDDLSYIEGVLARNELPAADVGTDSGEFYLAT